jgi:hypothetical protein
MRVLLHTTTCDLILAMWDWDARPCTLSYKLGTGSRTVKVREGSKI